jgi:hypothetical protein
MLREDERSDGRETLPDLARHEDALVGLGWRHANIDDRHVGPKRCHESE